MVNDVAITYGTALVDDDRRRVGDFTVLGLGESLFCLVGHWRPHTWSIQIVDVDKGHLLDVLEEREPGGQRVRRFKSASPTCSK